MEFNRALSADKYDESKRIFMLAMLCQLNVVNWTCLPEYRKDASWTVHNKRDNGGWAHVVRGRTMFGETRGSIFV